MGGGGETKQVATILDLLDLNLNLLLDLLKVQDIPGLSKGHEDEDEDRSVYEKVEVEHRRVVCAGPARGRCRALARRGKDVRVVGNLRKG